MRELFAKIADLLKLPFLRLDRDQEIDLASLRRDHRAAILFQDHSYFAKLPLSGADRGAHIVRDPRDVLISSANYHSWSHEAWLHRRRSDFGDRSYQEVIRDLPFAEAVRFEMRHSAGRAIRDMLSFDRRGRFADFKYEEFMLDRGGAAADRLFEHLGFAGREREVCLELFEASRLRREPEVGIGLRQHVQNLDLYQWRYMYGPDLLESFCERFADGAERLGYLPSISAMLIDDEPRRQAQLARFIGNRGRLAEARALVEASLARSPGHRHLLRAREALGDAAASVR